METFDKIDKQIIFELSRDSRQSYKQIAKKIKSKKDTIAYHISQLQKKGIITRYVPVFSLSKLGIYSGKIYLKLHGLSKEDEKRIIKSLIKNKSVCWVAKAFGHWDLLIGLYTKDIIEFSNKKNEILSQFSKFIDDYDITQIEDALVFQRDYMLKTPLKYREEFIFGGEVNKIELDRISKEIIGLIRNKARFDYIDLSKNLDLDARTIQRKIKELKSKNILQGYTCFIDINKLGYQLHKLCISLKDHKKENIDELISHLKKNPNTIHLIKSLGSWELEVEIETNKLNSVYEYISELKNKFPKIIKRIHLVTIADELKLDFFPEEV